MTASDSRDRRARSGPNRPDTIAPGRSAAVREVVGLLLPGGDRVVIGPSGMQRARRCPVTARTVKGMAPYPGQARCLALGFWPECFRRLDVKGGWRPFPPGNAKRP